MARAARPAVLEGKDRVREEVGVTAEHPFGVEGQGWTEAQQLKSGDRVYTASGASARVVSIGTASDLTTVFNFEVEQAHTYFIGQVAAWVHNQSRIGFRSGRGPHVANVTVYRDGHVAHADTLTSGGMTAEGSALGFSLSAVATHTEARAARGIPLQSDDAMIIDNSHPSYLSCKGAINKATSESGATSRSLWEQKIWTTGGR
ncbi:polymorphic toxin-type HINT domain-containing protein [Corallococcus sp. Z5C101001]|uniref:polymorphic toxin-type HINT domain-containing protein n=1 Tax=Corallococcus sp. Z5C101001 TaxID=2596829 RepID=UPI00163D69B8|nr:polymorphic toxin-type HINT domain-containing protein [Corallococcus sp. Z5C101001]